VRFDEEKNKKGWEELGCCVKNETDKAAERN